MIFTDATNSSNAFHRRLVADVTTERIAGIGRIDDHPATTHDGYGPAHQSLLRMGGVDLKVLAHSVET